MTTCLQLSNLGPIREIQLARPPVNALDTTLCRALIAAIEQAHADDVQGIVISGNDGLLTAGMDVPHLMSHGDDRASLLESWQAFFGAVRAIGNSRIPVVMAIGGHCPAGGCVLSLAADYRIMARSIDATRPWRIGLNEVAVGLVAPEGIQRLMRRCVGVHRAGQLLIGGEMVSAERALELGLVDELVDGMDVRARAIIWLEGQLRLPRAPMLATRAIARADLHEALSAEHIQLDRFVDAWYSDDAQAALTALMARLGKG
jgi:enoyl-CoA hydratase/carnithine racemase